eukprot:c5230_g1_i1.p1 GENE.c5230_g1_i1~~c5230_g1_i1.p1  ORF type:complete len:219 (+),score=54.33 c5230_g1_i1:70-726(+)
MGTVVQFDEDLRSDLFARLLEWEKKTDLCLTVGTSLSGMNADRVVKTVGRKAARHTRGILGCAIINLQETGLDDICTLRIFETIDTVMEKLLACLGLDLVEIPDFLSDSQETFVVPYDEDGMLDHSCSMEISMKVGSNLKITSGTYKGCAATVVSVTKQGHFRLRVNPETSERPFLTPVGKWWFQEAERGELPSIPVVPAPATTSEVNAPKTKKRRNQ